MQDDVEIGAESKLRVVFPGLHPLAVEKLVGGLPVVVGLVAVGDPGPHGGAQPHLGQKPVMLFTCVLYSLTESSSLSAACTEGVHGSKPVLVAESGLILT